MPRSGSTWLYNVARLLILRNPLLAQQFSCGWVGDLNTIPAGKSSLIKIHDYEENIVKRSNYILYSYRDVRDAIASSFRKFGKHPSISQVGYFIDQHRKWIASADYVMRYESMLQDKEKIVSEVAKVLNLEFGNPAEIVNAIDNMHYDNNGKKNDAYHMENLYHRGHITDGRHGSWNGVLSESLLQEIENKYSDWLIENGYEHSSHK